MSRIIVFTPAYNEQVNANLAEQHHLDCAQAVQAGHSIGFRHRHSCDLVWSRNTELDFALTGGYDWMVQQDADVFAGSPDGAQPCIMQLIQTAQKTDAAAVVAMVMMRREPPESNVWPCYPGRVYEAEKAGTGIILLDLHKIREWYDTFDAPCFFRTYKDRKGTKEQTGMDIFFTRDVLRGQHGQRLVCDARIPTVHINACHRVPYDGQHAADSDAIPDTAGQTVELATGA